MNTEISIKKEKILVMISNQIAPVRKLLSQVADIERWGDEDVTQELDIADVHLGNAVAEIERAVSKIKNKK